MLSPADKNLIVFLGTHGINWISENCGGKIKALNHGRKIQELVFHPFERSWLLASAFSLCEDYSDEPCRINKEVFMTLDLGDNWEEIGHYVLQFGWGVLDLAHHLMGIPKNRVLMTHDPRGKGHQNIAGWNYKIDFVYSDDFFKKTITGISKGNKFLLTKNYLYVAQVIDQEAQEVLLNVANPYDLTYVFKPVDLQNQRFREHSYTFLDTSEESVFLNVNHFGYSSRFGNIYISDSTGQQFSKSLNYNVRNENGHSEFDRV